MAGFPTNSFRKFLQQKLLERAKKNPSYSLRSFAAALGVSPAGLSLVMSGKKRVTISFIEKVSPALKLTPKEIIEFQSATLKERAALQPEKEYETIGLERLTVIKDWYHYAILNLMRVKGFKPEPLWISRRLGISTTEARVALERLVTVGILEVGKRGNLTDVSTKFTTHISPERTSDAARENQRQLFKLAGEAIDTVAYEQRNHTGVTLAFSKKDLEKAKQMISNFRREFHEVLDNAAEADSVYHLSLGLFPLTKEK